MGCSLWGCRELDTTEQLTHTHGWLLGLFADEDIGSGTPSVFQPTKSLNVPGMDLLVP